MALEKHDRFADRLVTVRLDQVKPEFAKPLREAMEAIDREQQKLRSLRQERRRTSVQQVEVVNTRDGKKVTVPDYAVI